VNDEEALRLNRQIERNSLDGRPYSGINRRATALLPPPRNPKIDKIELSEYSDHRKLLLSIEAKQQTACLRIDSEQEKSRSGVLIFRGRVLGCVYRNRGLDQYLFGEAAYRSAISDLASSERVVEGYVLKEELAITTASLFHGHVLEVPDQAKATEVFELTYGYLIESQMPGCIVLSSSDEQSVFMVYLFEGRIIGVYSVQDGWLESSIERIKTHLKANRLAKAQACILGAKTLLEILKFTFSLSGLADRSVEAWANRDKSPVPNVAYLRNHDAAILHICDNVVPLDRFIPRWSTSHCSMHNRTAAVNDTYHINP